MILIVVKEDNETNFIPVFNDEEKKKYPIATKSRIMSAVDDKTLAQWFSQGHTVAELEKSLNNGILEYCDALEQSVKEGTKIPDTLTCTLLNTLLNN